MSDAPQGPGWWQASDDKWYPPPRPSMPGDHDAAAGPPSGPAPGLVPPGATPPPGMPPAPPGAAPFGPPSFPPAGGPGPYGMPSGAPAGPGGPGGAANHTPLIIAGFVAAAALIVVVALVLTSGDDDPGTTTTGSTTTPQLPGLNQPTTSAGSDTTPAGDAGSAADLAVVETGFSTYRDYADALKVTYGAVLENNGEDDLTNISLSVSVLDADDAPLATSTVSIGLVRAGETIRVGEELFDSLSAEPAAIDIDISEPSPPLAAVPDGEVTTSDVSVSVDEFQTTANFSVTSTYAEQLDAPSAYAVFRNDAGDIVGGAWNVLEFVAGNGEGSGSVSAFAPIEGATTAEVWVGPGYL